RVNRAKKSGMVNITSSVNSRERSGINTILHELNPLFTINVTMRDIKSKNVYSRVNSKATTQWRKTESANGVHLEGVASDRIRMSRNFGMKMLTMTNLSTECLIQLTKLGYDATPFNQILKQNAKREMRLRLGKVT